jgi:Trp operon repressor
MSKPKKDLSSDIPAELIKELLTESENLMIAQRFEIVKLLKRDLSVRAIASKIGVGTDTVTRVSRMLKSSDNLNNYFKRVEVSPSKWIFGTVKIEEN